MEFDTKRERALKKLLIQIDQIEEKARNGGVVLHDQLEKLGRRCHIEKELEQLQWKHVPRRDSQISTQASRVSLSDRRTSVSSRHSLTIEEDPIGVEDLQDVRRRDVTTGEKTWHVDIRPFGSDFERDFRACLQEIRELSQDCFGSDSTDKCSKRQGWHLTVLTQDQILLGFISYKIRSPVLSIANIAVPVEQRRKGYGKALIRWAQRYARKQAKASSVEVVGLSALKESVPFYKAMGFHDVGVRRIEEDTTVIPGQVYMEYRLKREKNK